MAKEWLFDPGAATPDLWKTTLNQCVNTSVDVTTSGATVICPSTADNYYFDVVRYNSGELWTTLTLELEGSEDDVCTGAMTFLFGASGTDYDVIANGAATSSPSIAYSLAATTTATSITSSFYVPFTSYGRAMWVQLTGVTTGSTTSLLTCTANIGMREA